MDMRVHHHYDFSHIVFNVTLLFFFPLRRTTKPDYYRFTRSKTRRQPRQVIKLPASSSQLQILLYFYLKAFIEHGIPFLFQSSFWVTTLLYFFLTVYDWSVITGLDTGASCEDDLCKNGGLCLPGEGMRANPSPGTTACLCQPGFTGADCGRPMSSCAENPCKNKAFCTEDPSGGTGYLCNCDGTGFRGRHCELELGSCGLDACYNGGVCLEQPGGWLCQCPAQYGGMRCDNARASVSDMRLFLTDCATRYSIIGARKVLC